MLETVSDGEGNGVDRRWVYIMRKAVVVSSVEWWSGSEITEQIHCRANKDRISREFSLSDLFGV